MNQFGIVEGFFGPVWHHQARLDLAPFLRKHGGSFYIYAPKRDAHLRKRWREIWTDDYLRELSQLRNHFHHHQIQFGVALSPFELGHEIRENDWDLLKQKFSSLQSLQLDMLGLFFDDMPVNEELLATQEKVIKLALNYFPKGLIFCPSFYSYDPILDKVFGRRPVGYVEGLKDVVPSSVEICWTGPKVISDEISREHLEEVSRLLGRKPFIWENLYANDGPKNCQYLKLKYFLGRDQSLQDSSSHVAFNLMNQPYLSQVLFLSSMKVIAGDSPKEAFEKGCYELLPIELANLIIKFREKFLLEGLSKLTDEDKFQLREKLEAIHHPVSTEMINWLNGEYIVGPECLTD
jgi:hypothetical protein